ATTDSRGRASVQVLFGLRSGSARVAIAAPVPGAADTARYTILPGRPVRVQLEPRYTAITVGTGFTYRGTVADRAGNALLNPATFQAVGNSITLSSTGTVSATALGFAKVRIRASVIGGMASDSGT